MSDIDINETTKTPKTAKTLNSKCVKTSKRGTSISCTPKSHILDLFLSKVKCFVSVRIIDEKIGQTQTVPCRVTGPPPVVCRQPLAHSH